MSQQDSHARPPYAILSLLALGLVASALTLGCASGPAPETPWESPSTPLTPADNPAPDYDRRADPWTSPTPDTVTQQARVQVQLPEAARAELDVVTVAGRRALNEGASIMLPATNADQGILAVLVTKGESTPAAVAYIPPAAEGEARALSAHEVVLGNVYISPAVLLAPEDERARILTVASESDTVSPLVDEAEVLLASHPSEYLTTVAESGGLRRATELSIESTRSVAQTRANVGRPSSPYIEDLAGQDANLVNPRLTAYGYRIERADAEIVREGLLYGRAGYFAAVPRWPYITRSDPVREPITLRDGRYTVTFYKGLSTNAPASDMAYADTPWGQASLVNTLNLTTVVSHALGFYPQSDPDVQEWNRQIDNILDALAEFTDPRGLEANLERMHLADVVLTVLDYSLGTDLTDVLLDLVSGIEDAGVARQFFELMRDVYAIADQVYLAVQFVFTDVGFVYDLLGAPGTVTYGVLSTGGELREVAGTEK